MSLGRWIGLVAFIISLYILWQIREILLLVFAAVVFATAINRLVRVLQRLHLKRGIAIAVSIIFSTHVNHWRIRCCRPTVY